MSSSPSRDRIDIVNALRAFAAIYVAWGHFSRGQGRWLDWTGHYGYTGVYIFFVISGFIIPYSLHRSGYALRNFGQFMVKRAIRLYPPYLLSIPITLLAANFVLVPMNAGPAIHTGARQLFYHLIFINDLAGAPWINVVYWTLAIEWQWYVLAGLFFALLVSRNALMRFIPVAAAMVLYFLCTSDRVVFHTLPMFLIGVFVFQYKIGLIGRARLLLLMAAMLWAMRWPTGWTEAGIAVATGLAIAFVSFRHRIADFLGDVSYSVYLVHLPLGVGLISWLSRVLPFAGSYIGALDLAGMAAAIAASAVVYRWVEKPSQELSSRLRFTRAEHGRVALAAAAAK
jgi:peptidoglycan/LPS O-acetylase OafA/YrhL